MADIVTLALKAARSTNEPVAEHIFVALQNGDFPSWKIEHLLAAVAEYEGLNFVLAALRCEHRMVRDAAIYALLTLNNEESSAVLQQMLSDPTNRNLKDQVDQIARAIPESQRITECKMLGLLNEEDYTLAEALLDRQFIPADIPYLVKKLGNSNVDARRQAVNTLLAMRPDIEEFYATVERERIDVYEELIELLGRFNDPSRSTYVVKLLNSRTYLHFSVTEAAIQLLTDIADDQAITYLVDKAAADPNRYSTEVRALEGIGAPAVPHVLRAYASNESFRRTGGSILVTLAGNKAVPLLIEALTDRFQRVREDAELALIQLGSMAVKPLLTLLDHTNGVVRRHAGRALGRIGDGRASYELIRMSRGGNRYEHLEAVEALGGIQSDEAIEEVSRWLRSPDWETRRRAVKGLGNAKSDKADLLLVESSNDENPGVRLEAIHSIANQLFRQYTTSIILVEALLSATEDVNAKIATTAKNMLVQLGSSYNNIPHLLARLKLARRSGSTRDQQSLSHTIESILGEIEEARKPQPAGSSRLQSPPSLTPEVPKPITDNVHFSVTAPSVVTKNDSFVLDVWAHFGNARDLAEALEKRRGRDLHIRSRGPISVKRNTVLRVLLSIPSFGIEDAEDEIYWAGETGNCTFPVNVPKGSRKGFHLGIARFFVEDLQISRLSFEIEVGVRKGQPTDVTTQEYKVKTAFASYASEERNKVTARIQGMLKMLPELDIFLDVASLRSGENWRTRLEQEIISRDILYLFWSRAASKSPWVEIEWRTALASRGLEHIDPVPLEPGDVTPPPPELSTLHFNEWTLAFEKRRWDTDEG